MAKLLLALPVQFIKQGGQAFNRQGKAKHLPGGLHQLVAFIQHQGAVVWQNGPHPRDPVDAICQQQVVVADLEQVLFLTGFLQVCPVLAGRAGADTGLGDTHVVPVKAAQLGGVVQIDILLQPAQGPLAAVGDLRLFQLVESVLQPVITDIVALALAQSAADGLVDHACLHQDLGQKGQVLLKYRLLQRNAGGGDHHRQEAVVVACPEAAEHNASYQVGVGLSNAGPGIAQGDSVVQHGVKHQMTELDLFGTFCHARLGQQNLKNIVNFRVGVFSRKFCLHFHSSFSLDSQ